MQARQELQTHIPIPDGASTTADREQIAAHVANSIVDQVFRVSMDLHAALSLLQADHPATGKIGDAIERLDETVKDLRMAALDAACTRPPPPQPRRHRFRSQ